MIVFKPNDYTKNTSLLILIIIKVERTPLISTNENKDFCCHSNMLFSIKTLLFLRRIHITSRFRFQAHFPNKCGIMPMRQALKVCGYRSILKMQADDMTLDPIQTTTRTGLNRPLTSPEVKVVAVVWKQLPVGRRRVLTSAASE